MDIKIDKNGTWYHGSNIRFEVLKKGSTITQWKALAEAFSHQPSGLGYDDAEFLTKRDLKVKLIEELPV